MENNRLKANEYAATESMQYWLRSLASIPEARRLTCEADPALPAIEILHGVVSGGNASDLGAHNNAVGDRR